MKLHSNRSPQFILVVMSCIHIKVLTQTQFSVSFCPFLFHVRVLKSLSFAVSCSCFKSVWRLGRLWLSGTGNFWEEDGLKCATRISGLVNAVFRSQVLTLLVSYARWRGTCLSFVLLRPVDVYWVPEQFLTVG